MLIKTILIWGDSALFFIWSLKYMLSGMIYWYLLCSPGHLELMAILLPEASFSVLSHTVYSYFLSLCSLSGQVKITALHSDLNFQLGFYKMYSKINFCCCHTYTCVCLQRWRKTWGHSKVTGRFFLLLEVECIIRVFAQWWRELNNLNGQLFLSNEG